MKSSKQFFVIFIVLSGLVTFVSAGEIASNPNPPNGASCVDPDVYLSWSPGCYAASHDVYFDTSETKVQNRSGCEINGVSCTDPCYSLPTPLETNTTYYWAIDEVNDLDPNSPWKGDVWSFTTVSVKSFNPRPADGASCVDPNVVLSWSPGCVANKHDVYLGTNFNDVDNATLFSPEYKGRQDPNSYNPGGLALNMTYYWRIDEVNGIYIWKGDVWSFTTGEYQPSHIIVKIESEADPNHVTDVMSELGAVKIDTFSLTEAELWDISGGSYSVVGAIAAYGDDQSWVYFEPDYIVSADKTPDDPFYPQLWAMPRICADQEWDYETGDDVIIAVIDTGIDYTHPDLACNMWMNPGEIPGNLIDDDKNGYIDDIYGYDFCTYLGKQRDSDPMDDNYHGTHVAGTIAACGNNGIGVTGVSWHAKLMALKFSSAGGYGYVSDAIKAIGYAVDKGAKLSNNSWGCYYYSQALYDAIEGAGVAGQLFVAAAGNDGKNNDITPAYPASYDLDNIISVAATDSADNKPWWSNYGPNSVDLGAPGVNIYSTMPGNSYGYLNGTSMAAPHVSGAASLIWSRFPLWNHSQVKQQILNTVEPLPSLAGKTVTGGILSFCQDQDLDCNHNGVPDWQDILDGTSKDCNGNGIPDECETDCNGNGVPDDSDIDPSDPDGDHHVSRDDNKNGIPDECECCLEPNEFVCEAGRQDNFNTGDGSEPTEPSAYLLSNPGYCSSGALTEFDVIPDNICFIHTFGKCCWPSGWTVCEAKLEIRMKAGPTMPYTDSIDLRQNGDKLWGISLNDLISWWTGGTDNIWSNGQTECFILDLSNLPLGSGMSNILSRLQAGFLDVIVADDTGVDYMKLTIVACPCKCDCSSEITAGFVDEFALPIDPASPGTALNNCMGCSYGVKDFDDTRIDRCFGHTFTSLPPDILDAELEIRLKAGKSSLVCNDTISLQATEYGPPCFAWGRRIGGTGGLLGTWTQGNTHTFTLHLSALPNVGGSTTCILPLMIADERLDVHVQDDTIVDYAILRIWRCCKDKADEVGLGSADLNKDWKVNFLDLAILASKWLEGADAFDFDIGDPEP